MMCRSVGSGCASRGRGLGRRSTRLLAAVLFLVAASSAHAATLIARSYLAQVELPVTFGLGDTLSVERLDITWPDGASLTLTDIEADQSLTITHPGGASNPPIKINPDD